MGFMTGDEAGQGKRLTLFLGRNCVVIDVLCEALHFMLENGRSVILHEMTNYLLCMKSLKTSNNGCHLKGLRL